MVLSVRKMKSMSSKGRYTFLEGARLLRMCGTAALEIPPSRCATLSWVALIKVFEPPPLHSSIPDFGAETQRTKANLLFSVRRTYEGRHVTIKEREERRGRGPLHSIFLSPVLYTVCPGGQVAILHRIHR